MFKTATATQRVPRSDRTSMPGRMHLQRYGRLLLLTFCLMMAAVSPDMRAQQLFSIPPNKGMQVAVGKWMEIADNQTLVLDTFTVEVWVKAHSRFVIVSRDRPGNLLPDWSFVYEENRGRIEFMTGMNSQPDSYYWTPEVSFMPNQWNHFAAVVNGPAGRARVYINGAVSADFNFAPRSFTVRSGLAWGGYFGNGLGATGKAEIDEARYWRGERTQNEIRALKDVNIPNVHNYPNLHGWWRFCDNFDDSSIYGNHGKPCNMPSIVPIPDLPAGINCMEDLYGVAYGGIICHGESVQLFAEGRGGNPPYQYQWSPTATLQNWLTPTPVATPDQTTRYYVEITDSRNVTYRDSVTVVVHPELIIDAGGEILSCDPEPFRLTCRVHSGSPPYTFRWDPTPTLSPPDVQSPMITPPTRPGRYAYVVHVTDAKFCTATDTAYVTVRDGVRIDAGPDIRHCGGDPVQLHAEPIGSHGRPPFRYRWSPDSTLSDPDIQSPVARPTQTTTYVVRVTDADGCTDEDSVTVFIFPRLDVQVLGDSLLCNPDSVTITLQILEGTGPFSITWEATEAFDDTDPYRPRAFVRDRTTFTVRIRDANGCESEQSRTVVVKPPMRVDILGDSLICAPRSIPLQLNVLNARPRLNIQWSPPGILDTRDPFAPVAAVDSTVTVHVVVVDADGCIGRDSLRVTVGALDVALEGARSACLGDTVSYTLSAQSGDSVETAVSGGTLIRYLYPDQLRVSWDREGTGSIRCTVRRRMAGSLEWCDADLTIAVLVMGAPAPVITVEGVPSLCSGDSLQLRATPGMRSYRWITEEDTIPGTETYSVRRAGRFRVLVENDAGCEGLSEPVDVIVHASPQITLTGPRTVCAGSTAMYSVEATPGSAVTWLTENGTPQTASGSDSLRVSWPASGQGRIIVRAENGPCSSTDSITVSILDSLRPAILPAGTLHLCAGDSVRLTSDIAYMYYRWDTPTGSRYTRSIFARTPGEYRLFAESREGCSGTSDPVRIIAHEAIPPRITGPTELCEGDTAILSVSTGYVSYHWSDGTSGRVRSVRRAGTYQVTVTDSMGCAAMSPPHTLRVHPLPERPEIQRHGDTLFASPAAHYRWYHDGAEIPGSDRGWLLLLGNGSYAVHISDDFGCPAVSELFVIADHSRAASVVGLPDLLVDPGDTVVIPLLLLSSSRLEEAIPSAFSATIRFDASMLAPLQGTPGGAIVGEERVIEIQREHWQGQTPLKRMAFMATLGKHRETMLRIERFEWHGASVDITTQDGRLRMNICEEGGPRLFDAGQLFSLKQNAPNPASQRTVISFSTLTEGPVRLVVTDMYGRSVRTLVDGVLPRGEHEAAFDAGSLPSGIYLYLLQTSTGVRQRQMVIAR